MRHQQDGQAGFTLVEVLVSLALFALILSCFGTLFYRLEKTNAAIGRIERAENVNLVRRYLQRSLEGTRAQSRLGTDGVRIVRFEGEPSRLEFVSTSAGEREIGGLYETELWLDAEGRLMQRRNPLGWGNRRQATPDVLLTNLAELSFSYSSCPFEGRAAYVTRWVNTERLPFLISVTATFKTGEEMKWRTVSAFIPAAACSISSPGKFQQ